MTRNKKESEKKEKKIAPGTQKLIQSKMSEILRNLYLRA